MNIFKFWIHLENQPPDSIAKLCLNISDKMAEENKSGSWIPRTQKTDNQKCGAG